MESYKYQDITDSLKKVLNADGKELIIETPRVSIPFGLQSYDYNKKTNYFLKFEISEKFEHKICKFEEFICAKFSKDHGVHYSLKTQLQRHDYYDTKLTVKVKQSFRKFTSKCIKNKQEISFFDIQKYDTAKAFLTANVFFTESTILVKWSIDTLFIEIADNTE